MKRIMFSDRYGLTQAVLEGKKTMTRRLMTMTLHKQNGEKMEPVVPDNMFIKDGVAYFCLGNLAHKVPKENQPAYKVGEEVAVAQKYKDCWDIYQERWEAKKDTFDWLTPDAILGDQAPSTGLRPMQYLATKQIELKAGRTRCLYVPTSCHTASESPTSRLSGCRI